MLRPKIPLRILGSRPLHENLTKKHGFGRAQRGWKRSKLSRGKQAGGTQIEEGGLVPLMLAVLAIAVSAPGEPMTQIHQLQQFFSSHLLGYVDQAGEVRPI